MKTAFSILFLMIWVLSLNAQSLESLRQQKEKAVEEIRYTNQLIEKARKNEKASLENLSLLNNKITQRNNIISALNSEIGIIEESIEDNNLIIELLQNDLQSIKQEYAEMIRAAYKNRNAYDKILFLLSAQNFDQAYKRYLYLKQYTAYRQKQAGAIDEISQAIAGAQEGLAKRKAAKESLIGLKVDENKQLSFEKEQQDGYIKEFQGQQKSLRQKLNEQRRIEDQLEREIQRIIEEEARKSKASGAKGLSLTPEQKLVGDNFEQNKSRIPWPVDRGVITEHFGIQRHPVLKNITVENNGINIATDPGAKARAVFKGEVTRVFGITGGNMAVIIRHGKYLSVYSNLSEVIVKKGDWVSAKQIIGTIYSDSKDGGKTILKFQVWHENQKLDPEDWLVN